MIGYGGILITIGIVGIDLIGEVIAPGGMVIGIGTKAHGTTQDIM
jgi:hypothetical protein